MFRSEGAQLGRVIVRLARRPSGAAIARAPASRRLRLRRRYGAVRLLAICLAPRSAAAVRRRRRHAEVNHLPRAVDAIRWQN